MNAKPVPVDVRVAAVSGRLTKARKHAVEDKIARVIGRYWNAAYLGGTYPRTDFRNAFRSFTRGAARKAQHERGFLTNDRLGGSTEGVAAKKKRIRLFVLAPNGGAAGVTARVRLVYVADRDDAQDMRVTVTGRLMLTHKLPGPWQIFGYDVARSARPDVKGQAR